jgi:hypothetical protein
VTEAFDGEILDAELRASWQSLGSKDSQINSALLDHAEEIVDLSTPVHGSCYDDTRPSCQACGSAYLTKAAVNLYAKQTQYYPYRYHCGKTFSRVDVLSRYIQTFQSSSRFPCPHCEKFAGIKGFARRDLLIQHLRVCHQIQVHLEGTVKSPTEYTVRRMHLSCPHQDCLSHPDTALEGSRIFESQSELTKHMRAVHNECLFPCTETRCSRVGGKGFFRNETCWSIREHIISAPLLYSVFYLENPLMSLQLLVLSGLYVTHRQRLAPAKKSHFVLACL